MSSISETEISVKLVETSIQSTNMTLCATYIKIDALSNRGMAPGQRVTFYGDPIELDF